MKSILTTVTLLMVLLSVIILALYFFITNPIFSVNSSTKPILKAKASSSRLETHVRSLVEISPPRNHENVASLHKASSYIHSELLSSGLEAKYQVYNVGDNTYRNVVARITGREPGTIVIGAHYDVCGETPGADDNASAVAGLLELARLIKGEAHIPKHSLELVAWTLEEPPHFRQVTMGSYVHANSLLEQGERPLLAISLEMIGYFSDEKDSQTFNVWPLGLLYPSVGNFIAIVGSTGEWLKVRRMKTLFSASSDVPIHSINTPIRFEGVDFSDHLNFWKKGFPAVMLTDTAFLRNKNYHQATDTPETLNYEKMASVINGIAQVALEF
jgi:hypothetical protein